MKVEIELPAIISVDDYHEFTGIQDILNQLSPRQYIEYTETGYFDRHYTAVFYVNKPERAEIISLLMANALIDSEDEVDF